MQISWRLLCDRLFEISSSAERAGQVLHADEGALLQGSDDEQDQARALGRVLAAVGAAAKGSDNLVPIIIAAVEARATLGEIADAMRHVYGEHREMDVSR